MKIVFISDGVAFCNVAVPGVYRGELMDDHSARDAALSCAFSCDYFERESGEEYQSHVRSSREVLRIDFGGHHITHTIGEWAHIYDGVVNEPVIISQSEY